MLCPRWSGCSPGAARGLEYRHNTMQVQHQEPVVALALSPAADLCAVRTANGATGIMDLQQESFHTVLRCHTSSIIGLAVHPTRCLLHGSVDGDHALLVLWLSADLDASASACPRMLQGGLRKCCAGCCQGVGSRHARSVRGVCGGRWRILQLRGLASGAPSPGGAPLLPTAPIT
jgi:hypothetical protein